MSSERPLVDELDRPLEVRLPRTTPPPPNPDAGTPPSITSSELDDLWPIELEVPARLTDPAPLAERYQRLADTLHAESSHRDGPLRAALIGEAGRIVLQELGQTPQGQALIHDCGSPIPDRLIAATASPIFDISAALAALSDQADDPLRAPAERAAAWIEHGLLCEERCGEPSRALASYRAALALVSDHPIALGLASQAAASSGDRTTAYGFLTAAAASSEALGAAYHLEAASLAATSAVAREHLEAAAAGPKPALAAILKLFPRLRSDGDRRGALAALYRRYAALIDDPLAAGAALHLALTASGRTPTTDDPTLRAIDAWLEGQDQEVSRFPILTELVRTCEQQRLRGDNDDTRYIALLEGLAPFVDDRRERAVLHEQLARLRWAALKERRPPPPTIDDIIARPPTLSAEAAALYDALLHDLEFCIEHQPEEQWVRDTLTEVLRDLRDLEALISHLEGWAHVHPAGPGRAAILMRLGAVHEELGRDLAAAAAAYAIAVAESPRDPGCLRALGRIHEEMRRWPQAVDTLQRQADAADDPAERLAALRRLATLAAEELGDIELALDTLEAIAELDEDDILSLYQLAALARTHDQPQRLFTALEHLAHRLDDQAAKTAILHEIGEAQERTLGDVDAAISAYTRALEGSPGYTPSLRALARIYRGRGDLEAVLSLLDPKIDPLADPAVLGLRAARICLDDLSDVDRAIRYLFTSYNSNPDLAPTRVLLLQLLSLSGRIREAYDLLRAQDLPTSPALLADYHFRLGLLAESLAAEDPTEGDPLRDTNRALQHYRAALASQSDHPLALDRVRSLLVANHDRGNLIRFLEEQLSHREGLAKAGLQVQLARLHLLDPEGQATAQRWYEAAIEAAPNDAMIRREYENFLRQTDDTKGLPTLRLALARISEDTHYKATLLVESAEALLISGAPEDREFAANAILGALREDPGNPYAVRQLEGLLSDPSSPMAMTDAVGARAVRAQSDTERAIFYLESAELLERSGAREEAQRAYRAALRAMPSLAPAEMGLSRIASGAAQVAASAPKTKTVSIHTLMADARDAAVRAGTSGAASDAEEALALLGQILGRDPHYRDAIGLTRALAAQLSDPGPALNLLSTVFGRISDPALRYELGVFLGEQATADDNALAYFEVAANARPDGKQALRGLLRRHQRLGNEEASAEVMERLLVLFDPGEPSAIDLRLTLANYLAQQPKTLDRALEHARIVLQARSDDPRALLLMASLLERSDLPTEAVDMLGRLILRERDPDKLHELHHRRARLLAELPGRERDALAAAEAAAELNPADRGTILLLTRLLDRTGQTDRVSAFLEPIRGAMLANISRGQINPGDLKLLAEVAQGTNPGLARMARLLGHAFEVSSGPPPEDHMRAATIGGLERILATPTLRTSVLSPHESSNLNDLLTCIETAVERSYIEFSGLRTEDLVPIPPNVELVSLTPIISRWGALLGCDSFLLNAATTNNLAVLFEEGEDSALRLGINLWIRGDEFAWRGLAAIALARKALGGVMVRALTSEDLDLVLAASFETAKVFNAITADPDSRRLREISVLFGKQLGRRQRKTLLRVCQALASTNFEPTTTARGTLASDLRMAALISGDIRGCLSAACLLDGFANGSLKQRISFSRNAQELVVFLLSDIFLNLRELAIAP